jgi:uncharacterized Ntn-hydrolase superfamily protein
MVVHVWFELPMPGVGQTAWLVMRSMDLTTRRTFASRHASLMVTFLFRLGVLSMATLPTAALATWSIVAVDPETGEVGAAGATCWPGVADIARVVPGKGVVVAQGLTSEVARDHAGTMLQTGSEASAIVDRITSSTVDKRFYVVRQLRQYGVASMHRGNASVASFTGFLTWPSRGSREAAGVSVQGNTLASSDVLDRALEHFVSTPTSCGLAVALLNAIEAGAREGGDSRCSAEQGALSAFLVVARPNDDANAPAIRLIAPDQQPEGDNPVLMLREQLRRHLTRTPAPPGVCRF